MPPSILTSQPSPAAVATGDAHGALARWRAIWRTMALGALVLVTFALLWPSTASLMTRWEDTVSRSYTHGYAVLALCLWMIWRRRAELVELPPRPFYPAAFAMLAGAVAWLVAWRAGLQIVHQALVPPMIWAAVMLVFGWRVLARFALPFAYLLLAIPVWDAFIPLLQSISTFAVGVLIRLVGIPAFISGNTIQIPAGAFEIADGCSGLHFFNVALAISLLYGEVNRDPWRSRVKLVALALFMAMATNWLRIFIIAIAGHMTDMQHYLVADEHYSFGWGLFAAMMVIYFLIVRRWPVDAAAPRAAAPEVRERVVPLAALAVAIACLALAPAVLLADDNRAPDAALDSLTSARVAGVAAESGLDDGWQPEIPGADRMVQHDYSYAGQRVSMSVAAFARQTQGKEATGHDVFLFGKAAQRSAPVRRVGSGPWRETRVRDWRGAEWLTRYAYRLDADWYFTPLELQLTYGWRSLHGSPPVAVYVLRSRCAGDCERARGALDAVVDGLGR